MIEIKKMPQSLLIARPDGSLNAKDICDLLKVSHTTLHRMIEEGSFPMASWISEGSAKKNKREWRVSVLRKWFKEKICP